MFDVEEGEEVLYCYELHTVDSARRLGLGRLLMSALERVAMRTHMAKVMLTVFKANDAACVFYTRLQYEEDENSPAGADYLILSKVPALS